MIDRKHTPGPWAIYSSTGSTAEDGYQKALIHTPDAHQIQVRQYVLGKTFDELTANVHLMASAPDLLIASRDLLAENAQLRNAHATDERLLADIQAVLAQVEQERDGLRDRVGFLETTLDYYRARLAKVEEAAREVQACTHHYCTLCRKHAKQLGKALGGEVQSG